MKLSYNWLNDFVDLNGIELTQLAQTLTMGAFEVEEIKPTRKLLDAKVVLGEIKEIQRHPDADKLQVTKTEVAPGELLQIVCGAQNIAVGQRVPVALVGASVTNRHDGSELKIKESKIRGVESFGMLCSADELGFSEEEVKSIKAKQGDGIYLLYDPSNPKIVDQASQAKLGEAINKVLNFEQDYVIEVGARSNRGDALSVQGQAREIAALTAREFKTQPGISIEQDPNIEYVPSLVNVEPRIAKDSRDRDCSVFYTVNIENIEIKESPQWLKDRINAMGTKSINNVVDISNYVLLEMGQPMHFYDRDKLAGDHLEVRRARAGEKLVTLEEKEHELTDTNLVIADTKGPVSLAGVMGGLNSSIGDDTKNIVIEVAVFTPSVVRKSSRAAGVESESKRRFERGVDKANSEKSLLRAVELLAKLAAPSGSKIKVGKVLLAGSAQIDSKLVYLNIEQVERHLGISIDAAMIIELLAKLDIRCVGQTGSRIEFAVPSFRQMDIHREIDLIEEIGRLYGYDKIPARVPSILLASKNPEIEAIRNAKRKVREVCVAAGFSEAQLSSLIGDAVIRLDEQSTILDQMIRAQKSMRNYQQSTIEMDNPLSREHRVLRQSMLPSLIQAASRNYAYDKSMDIRLFEVGKVYRLTGATADANATQEEQRFAAILVKTQQDWTQSKPKVLAENFFFCKSMIDNLYPRAKFVGFDATKLQEIANSFVHPGISAEISQDRRAVGIIAKLHPSVCQEWDLPDETYVLELSLPSLQEAKFKPIANTPIVERDITVDSGDEVSARDIEAVIEKTKAKNLKRITLTSFFRREKTAEGPARKSTTFRLKWQSDSETLSGEAIDAEVESIKQLLQKELQVSFRA